MSGSILDSFCGSPLWDLNILWNTTNPDFPACFQKTVLVWVPCLFLWCFSPLELYFIIKSSSKPIPWTVLNVSKIFICLLLVILDILSLINVLTRQSSGEILFPADFWAPVAQFLTMILATVSIYGNKQAGFITSAVQFLFWFLMTIVSVISFRTHTINVLNSGSESVESNFIIVSLTLPLTVSQLILSSFADFKFIEKTSVKNPCPAPYSSFPNRFMYQWFDSLTWLGFRKTIVREDLWSLPHEFESTVVFKDFDREFVANTVKKSSKQPGMSPNQGPVSKGEKAKYPSLIKVLWKNVGNEFCAGMLLKVCSDVASFASPLMLKELIAFVSSDEPLWKGVMYAAVILFASILQSIFLNNHFYIMQNIGLKARGAVIAAIYRKALRMSSSAKRTSTTGEIVNLMSVDSQRLLEVFQYVGWSATIPIILTISIYLLWGLLGAAVLTGVLIMILMVPFNSVLASLISKLQRKLMMYKDQRTKLMNEILAGMKVLKLYAWELPFYDKIEAIRNKELKTLKKILYLQSVTTFVFQCTPFLLTLSTFATYIFMDEMNYLDATRAFVSLSLFDLLRAPIYFIPSVIVMVVQTVIAVRRIDKFMAVDEIDADNVNNNLSEECPVLIENGMFAWVTDEEPILKGINIAVPENALVAVVGSVGSGKSSLLSAILGEMEKRYGRVNVKGSVAYVAQQAWIQNATVKDNILFGKQFNEQFYKKVIDACALKPDFDILPGGDETEIGEKGINLSGGQKQRISLARAVYNNADIYLLDDPLSAVDAHVGKHIFEKVLGPKGLLDKKTRILVTHGISFLPQMNKIIVIKDGIVTETGSFKELLEGESAFSEIILTYLKEQELADEVETDELLEIQDTIMNTVEDSPLRRKLSRSISKAFSSDDDAVSNSIDSIRRSSLRRSLDIKDDRKKTLTKEELKITSKLIQAEHTETGKVHWSVYLHYFRSVGMSLSLITFFIFILSWTSSVFSNLWLSEWSKDQPPVNGTQDTALRDLRLGVYGALGFLQAVFSLIGSLTFMLGTIRACRILHESMLYNVLRTPMSFFDTTPLGRILNRFSRDVDVTDIYIPTYIRPVIDYSLQLVAVIVLISVVVPIFLIAVVPLGIIYYLIQKLFINTSRQLRRLESVSRSPIYTHFSETINGLTTIRAYQHQNQFIKESERRVDENHIYFFPFLVSKRWLAIRLELVGGMVVFCASLFSVLSRETLDPGVIGLVVTYSLSVTFILTFTVRMWTELESNIVSVERMKEYIDSPREAEWESMKPIPSNWPTAGVVEFQNYSTRYREGLELVLKGIKCDIKGKEKIGIVGRTGAGKSSLTLGLFRLIEAAGGSIVIDGIDISTMGLQDLRSQLTIIPQDPVLFSGSLRMNLDPFEKYSDHQIWEALRHSHLNEFVASLSSGLHHDIVEGGENLSVGQRQLICLARAILRKTKILILDEATAAIDMETDDLIQETIRKEFADCTILTIAHRINTIVDSTRVMVLENGIIKEFDKPSNLLSNKNSLFYSMAKDAGLV